MHGQRRDAVGGVRAEVPEAGRRDALAAAGSEGGNLRERVRGGEDIQGVREPLPGRGVRGGPRAAREPSAARAFDLIFLATRELSL